VVPGITSVAVGWRRAVSMGLTEHRVLRKRDKWAALGGPGELMLSTIGLPRRTLSPSVRLPREEFDVCVLARLQTARRATAWR
jgi:hypothetical protein